MNSKKLQDAFNRQIQAEIASSYLYLGMAAYAESLNFKGIAHWLKAQHLEEMGHAYKMIDYLGERGAKVALQTLEAPPAEFGSVLNIFEQVLAHEKKVTASIHALHQTAVEEKDLAAQIFLQWFVTEQVEEEASASEIVEKIRYAGEKSGAVLYLDKELGKRGRS